MSRKSTDFIIIHCAATKPNMDTDVRDIDRWHRAQGWRCVGYHFFIKRDGTVQTGRELLDTGAHAGSQYNGRSLGICMAGGISESGKAENNFTAAQWNSLKTLVAEMKSKFPQAQVIGHRDVAPKDCPCFDAKKWHSDTF